MKKTLLLMFVLAIPLLCMAEAVQSADADSVVALPRLIDLGSGSCVPCKMMMPVLDALRSDFAGQIEVVYIDVKENRAEAQAYNIRVIPTQVYVSASGEELWRHEGFMARGDIVERMRELGMLPPE